MKKKAKKKSKKEAKKKKSPILVRRTELEEEMVGTPPAPPRKLSRCPVRDCTRLATEGHHVQYERHEGGPVVFDLCSEHHSWITRAQSHVGRKQRFELTVKQRWFFWFKLKNGEMKRPRNTRLDEEWRENFRKN
jgi:hypothetical protein